MSKRDDSLFAYRPQDSTERQLREMVDQATRLNGIGAISSAYTNAMMGFDHRFSGIPIPVNAESRGMVFFTRPRLNLSYDNIILDRTLTTLITRDENSLGRAIRVLLDPPSANQRSSRMRDGRPQDPIRSNLVDPYCPFIPILSNALLSLSGWPDTVVDLYNAQPGIARETWFHVDGPHRYFGEFPLTGSWRNLPGDPITNLFRIWIVYAANVYRGSMMPHPEAIIEREIDYQTRIYHFVLDPSRRYIQKTAVAAVAMPTSAGFAAAFNFSSDSVYQQDSMRQISLPFHCVGAEYNDPINLDEFNRLQAHFNPVMKKTADRNAHMVKLQPHEINAFNFYGYPRVNMVTLELEWWVFKKEYQALFGSPSPVAANASSKSYRDLEEELWNRTSRNQLPEIPFVPDNSIV